MPIYEYTCQACGETFDHLWASVSAAEKASGAPLACPHCESAETRRIVSRVAVLGELGGLTPGEAHGARAQEERKASFTSKDQIQQLQSSRESKRLSGEN